MSPVVAVTVLGINRRDGVDGRLVSELQPPAAGLDGPGARVRGLLEDALGRGVAVGVGEAGLLDSGVAALVEAGVAGCWAHGRGRDG